MVIYLGMVSGIFATFLWALFPALCKLVLVNLSPYQFLILRYGISFGFLMFLSPRVFKYFHKIPMSSWALIFVMASLHNATQALCLTEVPVFWYVLFFSCSPILTYFLFPGHRHCSNYAYLFLAVLGTYVFIDIQTIPNAPSGLSLFYLFLSVVSWAFLTRVMIVFHEIYTDFEVSYILNGSNFLIAILLFFLFTEETISNINWSETITPLVLISITSPLAIVLFSKSLRIVPTFCIASQYIELFFGLVIGYVLFQESPTSYQVLGSAFIIAALIGTTKRTIREKSRLSQDTSLQI